MTTLGRLEKVELRQEWPDEAQNFTPWLAEQENMNLLGDTIGLDLEVEAQEKDVGPFRADILCKDTTNDNWVLVENQLEKTDHKHLGQLMTYASGLNAVTIVWVAKVFTDEHRAVLDWLNEITDEDINFFGLEIELWKIGESNIAPKFNIVSKPNDWTKSVHGATRSIRTGELSETKQQQYEYWKAFRQVLTKLDSGVKGTKPRPQHWNNFSVGRTGFGIATYVNSRDKLIGLHLICRGDNATENFHALYEHQSMIEERIGQSLVWDEKPERKRCQVDLWLENQDPLDNDNWTHQHDWLAKQLVAFHNTFRPIIRDL